MENTKLNDINNRLFEAMWEDNKSYFNNNRGQEIFESVCGDTELLLEALNTYEGKWGNQIFNSNELVFYMLCNPAMIDERVFIKLRKKILSSPELARIIIRTSIYHFPFLDLLLSFNHLLLSYKEKAFVIRELLCSSEHASTDEPIAIEINQDMVEFDTKGDDLTNSMVKNNYNYCDFPGTFITNNNFTDMEKKHYMKVIFNDEEWKLYMQRFSRSLAYDYDYGILEWHLYDEDKQRLLLNDEKMFRYAKNFPNPEEFLSYLKMVRIFIMLYNDRPYENTPDESYGF